jgi:hypothetical protein
MRTTILQRKSERRERITVCGLSNNHNHDLKNLFKGAAISASARRGPLHDFYVALLGKGMRPTMARLTLARKMAAITLTVWKTRSGFRPPTMSPPDDETQGNGNPTRAKPSRSNRGARLQRVGWMSRQKIFSASGRGRAFFLISFFIELIDRRRKQNRWWRLCIFAVTRVTAKPARSSLSSPDEQRFWHKVKTNGFYSWDDLGPVASNWITGLLGASGELYRYNCVGSVSSGTLGFVPEDAASGIPLVVGDNPGKWAA